MAIETLTKIIGNNEYMVTQLPARRALRLQAKLVKLLGPSAALMIANASKDPENADDCLPQAVTLIVNQLDEKTFDQLVIEMLQQTRKNGMELNEKAVDSEFAGNLNELFLVLQYVLEVNFGDFFQEGGILKGLAKEPTKEMPQASTKV
jgi:hypothetical protein